MNEMNTNDPQPIAPQQGVLVRRRAGDFDVVEVWPMGQEEVVVAVVSADGRLSAAIASERRVGPSGYWGCAVCEQLHPVELKACPLATCATRAAVIGPLEVVGGETFYFVGCERADVQIEIVR